MGCKGIGIDSLVFLLFRLGVSYEPRPPVAFMNREARFGWGQLECDGPLGSAPRNHILTESINVYYISIKFEIQIDLKCIVSQPNLLYYFRNCW